MLSLLLYPMFTLPAMVMTFALGLPHPNPDYIIKIHKPGPSPSTMVQVLHATKIQISFQSCKAQPQNFLSQKMSSVACATVILTD